MQQLQTAQIRPVNGFWLFFIKQGPKSQPAAAVGKKIDEVAMKYQMGPVWFKKFQRIQDWDAFIIQGSMPLKEGQGQGAFCQDLLSQEDNIDQVVFIEMESSCSYCVTATRENIGTDIEPCISSVDIKKALSDIISTIFDNEQI